MRDPDPITSELRRTRAGDVVVLGAPWEEGSSYLRGAAMGPDRIREALLSPARSLVTESGDDLAQQQRFRLLDDLDLRSTLDCAADLEGAAGVVLDRQGRLLTLGGDHSISVGLLRAHARRFPGLTLVQVDAHPDLYEEFQGDRWSHACPMARILEEGLVGRLIQIGIRAMTPAQRELAERHRVEIVPPEDWIDGGWLDEITYPVYLSFDLDGLDPAFAPGVSHPEPGGLTTRQALTLLRRLSGRVAGADLVELNPLRDPTGLTAVVAAKLVKELAEVLLEAQV